jgi:hypothetical protein
MGIDRRGQSESKEHPPEVVSGDAGCVALHLLQSGRASLFFVLHCGQNHCTAAPAPSAELIPDS